MTVAINVVCCDMIVLFVFLNAIIRWIIAGTVVYQPALFAARTS